ncbi:MAG: nuclear transport factor 2 family protein [Acidobacteria bacterium]|nr:nuclear transport factor 2 family protein [Acidobacteriota bacterium]
MDSVYFNKVIQDVRPTGDVIPELFSAIARGDFDAMAQFLTPDAELVISGLANMAGCWSGREAVVEATRRNFGMVAEQRPVVERQITSGDTTAILFRETGVRKDNRSPYSVRVSMWITTRGGQVCRVEEIAAACE